MTAPPLPGLLIGADALWTTAMSESIWQRVLASSFLIPVQIEKGAQEEGEKPPDASKPAYRWLIASGSDPEPRFAQLVVHQAPKNRLSWSLNVRTSPDGEPPEDFVTLNSKVNGRGGLANLIRDGFAQGGPPIANYQIFLAIDAECWKSQILPRDAKSDCDAAALPGLASQVHLQHVGYRLEEGANGIREIYISYDSKTGYSAAVTARAALSMEGEIWLPYANTIAEIVLRTFFTRKEGKHAIEHT